MAREKKINNPQSGLVSLEIVNKRLCVRSVGEFNFFSFPKFGMLPGLPLQLAAISLFLRFFTFFPSRAIGIPRCTRIPTLIFASVFFKIQFRLSRLPANVQARLCVYCTGIDLEIEYV